MKFSDCIEYFEPFSVQQVRCRKRSRAQHNTPSPHAGAAAHARSQPVPPVASTASIHMHLPLPAARDAGPSLVQQIVAQQAQVAPTNLCGPLLHLPIQQVGGLVDVVGSGSRPDRFSVLDLSMNLRSRRSLSGWSAQDFVTDAIRSVPYMVRRAQLLVTALPDTDTPNVVLTPLREPRDMFVIPVDLRDWGDRIFIVKYQIPGRLQDIVDQVVAKGADRNGRLRQALAAHRLSFRDAQDTSFHELLLEPDSLQWLTLQQAREEPQQALLAHQQMVLHADGDATALLQTPMQQASEVIGPVAVTPKSFAHETPGQAQPRLRPVGILPGSLREVCLPDPTDRQLIGVEDLTLLPPEFRDEHVFSAAFSKYKWGKAGREHFGKYTIFDTHRHATIATGAANADLQSLVAQAVADAPFVVGALQILTTTIEGLPKPQVVLHEAGRPLPAMPVPWDLRRPFGTIRTIEHRPGQNLRDALSKVQDSLTARRGLLQDFDSGALAVTDASGPVIDTLPQHLLRAQFFELHPVPSEPLVTQHATSPILAGGSLMQEGTTQTTTWMQATAVPLAPPILRLIVMRGSHTASADVNPPYRLVDRVIVHLLAQVSSTQYFPVGSTVVLAGAMPPPIGYVQEVLLVVTDTTTSVPCVWDSRAVGGGLQVLNQDRITQTTEVLSTSWTAEGWQLAVNGVPSGHIPRGVQAGDFLQPYHGERPYLAVPLGHILQHCPQLQAFAWPLCIRDGGLPMATFATLFPSIVSAMRERRDEMGLSYREAGCAVVMGTVHGPVHLYFANPMSPGIHEVADTMVRLDRPPPWADVLKAAVYWPEKAMYTTTAVAQPSRTVLLPAPFFAEQHFVMTVPANPGLLAGLPAEDAATLMPRRSLATGDVLYLQRDPGRAPEPDSEIDEEFAVLLQQPMTRQASPRFSVPTPLGRRALPQSRKAQRQQLCLSTAIPSTCEAVPVLSLGVTADSFQDVFGEYTFDTLCLDWRRIPGLPAHCADFLANLPTLPQGKKPEAVQVYADGSFFAPTEDLPLRSGWALCFLGRYQEVWYWLGFVSADTGPEGNRFSCGVKIESAFEPELSAVTYGHAYCINFGTPAMLAHDNTAAADVAFGAAKDCRQLPLTSACLSMQHLARLQRQQILRVHVKAHSNHPLNDFVDAAAKAAARSLFEWQPPVCIAEAQEQEVLPWLWCACGMSSDMPAASDTGVIFDRASRHALPITLAAHFQHQATPPLAETAFDFKAATYNALSLASLVQRESLDQQFDRAGIALVGLQETRQDASPRGHAVHYHVLASRPDAGQLGCQIWLHRSKPIAWSQGRPVTWDDSSFSVLASGPRHLLATAKAGSTAFAILSAHAPTCTTGASIRQAWWASLHSLVRGIPPRHTPILLIDANARFEWGAQPPSASTAANHNAEALVHFLGEHALVASPNQLCNGTKVVSYLGPACRPACLDYIVLPRDLSIGAEPLGAIPDFQGCSEQDHFPVQARLRWTCSASQAVRRPAWDVAAMRSPEGKMRIRQIFAAAPRIPWSSDVDSHLLQVNEYLKKALSQAFPKPRRKPRSGIISDTTWTLVQDKRDTKRLLHAQSHQHLRQVMAELFRVWRGRSVDRAVPHMRRLHLALLAVQLRGLNRLVKEAARADSAAAARQRLEEARGQGPEALFNVFRQITKTGRRFRDRLNPTIVNKHGEVEADSLKAPGDNFARAERARPVAMEDVSTPELSQLTAPLPMTAALGIPALARGFLSLKPRKAAGPSGLPAELYAADAIGAAALHAPIVYKVQARGSLPSLWRGGVAHAIPKPGKAPSQLEAWRSILLCEPALKGVTTALRTPLLEALERLRTAAQGGSRPKMPLQVPMAIARGFMNRLRRDHVNGALCFVDGKSAFYATARERLLGRDMEQPVHFLNELADSIFENAQDRLSFLRDAVAPGLLESAQVPASVRRLLTATFKSTWFTMGSSGHTYLTTTGTCPGTPLADVNFQLLFAEALRTSRLLAGLPKLKFAERTKGCPPPRGKTELVPYFCGPGSKQFRRTWLCSRGAPQDVG